MSENGSFAAETHNGSITINGAEVNDCNVTATIKAKASSEENAKKLAEQVNIKLESINNKITVEVEKPDFIKDRSVSVNLNVTVPSKTGLELNSHNGGLKMKNIKGNIEGKTYNGGVTAKQVFGSIELETYNGNITCREISGDAELKTYNGRVKASYSKTAVPVCNISIETYNGGIKFTAPANFSAEVDVSTHNGSINTDIPITVIGRLSKNRLKGTIGEGKGKLRLQTHNGSIKIRQQKTSSTCD
jgi:Zn-dependent metalloprotease